MHASNNPLDGKIGQTRERGIAFFPTLESLSGNPYWPILADELKKKSFIVALDTPGKFDLKWLISNRNRIKVINLHFVQQFYKSSTTLKKIVKFILFTANMLIARSLGYRTVFTLHNLEPTYDMKPLWLDYLGHWVAANLSSRVIVYCHEARRLLQSKYGRTRDLYYVDHPNLIDYYPNEITRSDARKTLSLSDEAFVFAFIGGVRPNKGVEILIQAFQQLENPRFRLVIAGGIFPPPTYAESLKEISLKDDRINLFLNRIPDEEFQIYLNAADVVVLPFAKILTSGTANLAMSFARPVIVPNVGCLPEMIETDKGWGFEQGNVDALAGVMERAAQSNIEDFGKRAFERMKKYSPERFVEETLKAYYG